MYKKCQTRPWSESIKIHRLKFLGHLLRLDIETPARKALEEYFRPTLRDPGRPVTTWWTIIKKDLEKTDVTMELIELLRLAANRKE